MKMPMDACLPVASVVRQHAEEAALLRNSRPNVVAGPHVKLRHLQRLDERLAAHLDGLAVAGQAGVAMCWSAFEHAGIGEVFTASVRAIESKDVAWLGKILALVEADQDLAPGLHSAFGWVSAQFLQGTIKGLLESSSSFRQQLGIACCAMHRVDPGPMLQEMLRSADAQVRAACLKATGECGRIDLRDACIAALADGDEGCRYFAARSAVLLGDRGMAIKTLGQFAVDSCARQASALRLILKVSDLERVHAVLKTLATEPGSGRLLALGAGLAGDPYYAPWLIRQMGDVKLARLAGEAFSVMTGVDLEAAGLASEALTDVLPGPSDAPQDDNVAMDEDDHLAWPDQVKVTGWWNGNQHRFQNCVRYFMGEPPSVAHCLKVLRNGYQRQRIAAAEYLCLLQPGTKLFPTSAPAWRQQRWLKQMES